MADIFDEIAPEGKQGDIFDQITTSEVPTKPDFSKYLGTEQGKIAAENLRGLVKENLPLAGSIAGGALAAPANIIAPGVAEAAGIGGGYLAGKWVQDLLMGAETTPGSVAQDVKTGSLIGMAGPVAGKFISKGVQIGDTLLKTLLGRLTGTGVGATEQAVTSGMKTGITMNPLETMTKFDQGLRGELSGQEIVQNVKTAAQVLKDQRAADYQAQFAGITQNKGPVDFTPIKQKMSDLMGHYGVKVSPTGEINTSRIAMGEGGRRDIKDVIERVNSWGTQPDDNTALGLDVLKRQLDDFWSESSQARAFVASLRDTVRDTIVDAVPEYAQMTKGYAEATQLIKDIDAGLMLRKQAMTGRVVADQTLRRLMSSMRENFPLRRDLVNALGAGTGEDLSGQIAGFVMSSPLPQGLAGTGPGIVGLAAALKYLNPKFLPIVAASSPRVAGEFLRLYGKGVAELAGTSGTTGTIAAYEALRNYPQPEEPKK